MTKVSDEHLQQKYYILSNLRPIFIPETHRKYLCKKRKADKN